LTTARYGQLQPSTKTTVQVIIKKTDENINIMIIMMMMIIIIIVIVIISVLGQR
jgi:hypothetical protein